MDHPAQHRPSGRRHQLSVLAALVIATGSADAADLVVYSVGAMRAVVSELGEVYRRETGHTLRLTSGSASELQARIEGGASADLVIAPQATINRLAAKGLALAEASHVIAGAAAPQVAEAAPAGAPTSTTYVAAPTPRGADAAMAQAFIELLTRPAMRARFAAAGLDLRLP